MDLSLGKEQTAAFVV